MSLFSLVKKGRVDKLRAKLERDAREDGDGQLTTDLKSLDVNAVDKKGRTCLALACDLAEDECVDVLLEYGADTNIADKEQQTALWLACHGAREDIALRLLEVDEIDPNLADVAGLSPLHLAVKNRMVGVVHRLGKVGVDADCADVVRGTTPLLMAVEKLDADMAMHLVESLSADVNKPDVTGDSPLMYAARNGDEEMIRYLCKHGAKLDHQNAAGETALHVVYEQFGEAGSAIAQVLEQLGADTSIVNGKGLTPSEVVDAKQAELREQAEQARELERQREEERAQAKAEAELVDPETLEWLRGHGLEHIQGALARRKWNLGNIVEEADTKRVRGLHMIEREDQDQLIEAIEELLESRIREAEEVTRLAQEAEEAERRYQSRFKYYALAGVVVVLAVLYIVLDYVASRPRRFQY